MDDHMVEFKKLPIANNIKFKKRNVIKSWLKKLENRTVIKHDDIVTDLAASSQPPHNYIHACANKCYLYNGISDEVIREYTTHATCTATAYRRQGRLFVCAQSQGNLDIFDDESSRLHSLRTINAHAHAIHTAIFSENNINIFSGCESGVLKQWDVSTGTLASEHTAHSQRLKIISSFVSNHNLIATGSYDHTIKIFDTRTSNASYTLSFGAPVEHLIVHPNGMMIFACGGNSIQIWDLNSPENPIHKTNSHFKTVTSLSFSHSCSYFHSSSLDGNVKSYNTQTFELICSTKFSDPVLKILVLPTNDKFMASLISNKNNCGLLHIKSKVNKILPQKEKETTSEVSIFKRYFHEESEIQKIDKIKRPSYMKYKPYEKYLRKFNYQKAFEYVFNPKKDVKPTEIIEFIKELYRRSSMRGALKNSNTKSIIMMLNFISKQIREPQYTSLLIELTNNFIDWYKNFDIFQSQVESNHGSFQQFSKELDRILKIIAQEIHNLHASMEILGALDLIKNVSAISNAYTVNDDSLDHISE